MTSTRGVISVAAMALGLCACGGKQVARPQDEPGPADADGGEPGEPSTSEPPADSGPCEPVAPPTPRSPPGDPGEAGTEFGPLMGGSATTGDEKLQLVGTAAAVTVPNGSHLFFIPTRTDAVPDAYMSLVVADSAWSPNVYTQPVTGALELTTAESCSYRLDLAGLEEDSSAFRLEVTESGEQQGGGYILRGKLDAELPSLQGRPSMQLSMIIN